MQFNLLYKNQTTFYQYSTTTTLINNKNINIKTEYPILIITNINLRYFIIIFTTNKLI